MNDVSILDFAPSELHSTVRSEERDPYLPRGWSGNANMVTGSLNKQTGIQRDALEGGGQYTVQFSVQRPTEEEGLGIYSAVAVINWFTAGNRITRRVSVTDGRSISGVAEGVSVDIFDVTPDEGQALGLGYTIGISVAKGSRASQNQPPTLSLPSQQFFGSAAIPAGGTVTLDIPQDCGVLSLEVIATGNDATQSDPNVTVAFVSATGSNVYKRFRVGPTYPGFIPVADNASQVILTNLDLANSVEISTVWGIDG